MSNLCMKTWLYLRIWYAAVVVGLGIRLVLALQKRWARLMFNFWSCFSSSSIHVEPLTFSMSRSSPTWATVSIIDGKNTTLLPVVGETGAVLPFEGLENGMQDFHTTWALIPLELAGFITVVTIHVSTWGMVHSQDGTRYHGSETDHRQKTSPSYAVKLKPRN